MHSLNLLDFEVQKKAYLIEASAGTGKTYSITGLYLKCLLQQNLQVEAILVVTFTVAATAELRERIFAVLHEALAVFLSERSAEDESVMPLIRSEYKKYAEKKEEKAAILYSAIQDFDKAAIFTIHGFCQTVLKRYALEAGVLSDLELQTEEIQLQHEVFYNFIREKTYEASEENIAMFESVKNDLLPLFQEVSKKPFLHYPEAQNEEETLKLEFLQYAKAEIENIKEKHAIVFYSDLIEKVDTARHTADFANALAADYHVVMIDEFQDTDQRQFRIFRDIFGKAEKTLFFIGDPKQSIYAFRGADVYAYIEARNYCDEQYTLKTNYRSHPKLVEGINTLFLRRVPFGIPDITYNANEAASVIEDADTLLLEGKDAAAVTLAYFDEQEKGYNKDELKDLSQEYCVGEIVSLLKKAQEETAMIREKGNVRALKASDIAVLVRTKKTGQAVQKSLKKYGVDAVVLADESVFASAMAKDLQLFLDSVLCAGNTTKLRSVLSCRLFQMDLRILADEEKSEEFLNELLLKWKKYQAIWEEESFFTMFLLFLKDFHIRKILSSADDGLRNLSDLMHLAELFNAQEKTGHCGPEQLLLWYKEKLEDAAGTSDKDEYALRIETDRPAVRIVTIHSSKGLEYNIVFCPFLFDFSDNKFKGLRIFHDAHRQLQLSFHKDDEEAKITEQEEALSENLRLIYVALTRAKYKVYFSYAVPNSRAGFFYTDYLLAQNYFPHAAAYFSKEKKNGFRQNREIFADVLKQCFGSTGQTQASLDLQYNPQVCLQSNYAHEAEAARIEEPLPVTTRLLPAWQMSSFSNLLASLKNKSAYENSRHDVLLSEDFIENTGTESEESLMKSFPKGAKAGLCLHEVFEQIDFHAEEHSDIIQKILGHYGYPAEDYCIQVNSMLAHVLNVNLFQGIERFSSSLQLKSLEPKKLLHEIEFVFPVCELSATALKDLLRQFYPHFEHAESLSFDNIRGYLKGYVDLLFEHNQQFFVLDWKSNYLGQQNSDYSTVNLNDAMDKHHYYLQYIIYALAVHRYLKSRLHNYSYEKHFGGVFYLFLRGIHSESTDTAGIYYDKPDAEFIQMLDEIIGKQEAFVC